MLITKTYVISFLLHFIYWWINSLCPCLCLFSMGSQLEGILAPFYFHFNVFKKDGGGGGEEICNFDKQKGLLNFDQTSPWWPL